MLEKNSLYRIIEIEEMRASISIITIAITASSLFGEVDLRPLRQYEAGSNSTGLFAADFDLDGDVDVAVSNRVSNSVSILENIGSGLFLGPYNFGTGEVPRYVDGADFNEDGYVDLCTPDYVGDTTTVLLNNGEGVFAIAHQEYLFTPAFLWVDDLDLDGHADILNLHWDENADLPSQSPALFTPMYGKGDGTFEVGPSTFIGEQPRCGACKDLNGDGIFDIVSANYRSKTLSILFGQGNRTFSNEVI